MLSYRVPSGSHAILWAVLCVTCYPIGSPVGHMMSYKLLLLILIHPTIHFHNMRKLNPMNRPRTPPLSATRSSIENAFNSLKTWIEEEVKNAFTSVKFQVFGLCIGSSITCVIRHVYYHNIRCPISQPISALNSFKY